MRETSIDAYHAIKDSGILTRMQFEAYAMLHEHGPMTGSEMNQRASNPSFHKRLSELEEQGVIETKSKRICNVTGELVHEWRCVDALPSKINRKAPPRPKIKQILVAVQFMKVMYRMARTGGIKIPEEFVAVAQWLSWLARRAK